MIQINGVDPRMIANNLIPYEPTHPGELVKDEIGYALYVVRVPQFRTLTTAPFRFAVA